MSRQRRRAAVIRHEAHVHLGNFETVLDEHGYDIEIVDASAPGFEQALTGAADADLLIVLGSTAGVYESDRHTFIATELAAVRERLASERPTLGVCFGAQLIAAALGSEVRRGGRVDVGYRPLALTDAGLTSPVRHTVGVAMAEWHGDTFDLPEGTTLLASSAAYENEAYGIGEWMLAVQFHPELTDEMHEQWLTGDLRYVTEAGYTPEALRADRERHGAAMQEASARMLADYLGRLDAP
ncbi:MAG: glutamine amidotransferase [Herbiconiux sp.]|uniref:glutamine amidotransferase-related protein n=1 Tax=Herbiconiux sp. TaxID=1871186 RepID=UPI0012290E87|nr:glutamine amidotransferase [Herbiconiux sp.]TAJ47997.1 MAG: glutamine amidotransferase [Herbiconiux sp.]